MAKMATRKLCSATLSTLSALLSNILSHPVRGKCFRVCIACRKGKGVASIVKSKRVEVFTKVLDRVLTT
jgi:hypothetical protein